MTVNEAMFPGPLSCVPTNPDWYASELMRVAGPGMDQICEMLDIRAARTDFDPEEAGTPALLAPERGGFVAIVASCVSDEQARFYLAHEVAHALFYDRHGETPTRTLPFTPAEDRFCNGFAAELLRRLGESKPRVPYQTRPPQTHCSSGHAMIGNNVIVVKSGYRRCRECTRRAKRHWAKRKYDEDKERADNENG